MARRRGTVARPRIFVALPSQPLEATYRAGILSEYEALVRTLEAENFHVVCPLRQAEWSNRKPADPHVTLERRLQDLEDCDQVLVLPTVGRHMSAGVMGYTFWSLAKKKPTTAYMRGSREAYDLDIPWQLIGLRDSPNYGLKIATYAHNLSDGFDDLLAALRPTSSATADANESTETPTCPFGSTYEKYWRMRHELFTRWDDGIKVDAYGLCSVKPERIAREIASHLPGDVVLDACCGVGGVSIALAAQGKRVIAVDADAPRIAMAKHNARIYGVARQIEFHEGDIGLLWHKLLPECQSVYLDPSWGGPGYDRFRKFGFDDFQFQGLATAQRLIHEAVQANKAVAVTLPRNFDSEQLWDLHRGLVANKPDGGEEESRTIQLVWHVMGPRLLFMTVFLNLNRSRNGVSPESAV